MGAGSAPRERPSHPHRRYRRGRTRRTHRLPPRNHRPHPPTRKQSEGAPMKPTRTCSIDGCESSYRMRRGWCNSHYIRWRKYGDPLKGGRTPYRDPRAALTERTERRGDCAIWLGATNGHGYGQLRINGVLVSAHRFAWEETNGP